MDTSSVEDGPRLDVSDTDLGAAICSVTSDRPWAGYSKTTIYGFYLSACVNYNNNNNNNKSIFFASFLSIIQNLLRAFQNYLKQYGYLSTSLLYSEEQELQLEQMTEALG